MLCFFEDVCRTQNRSPFLDRPGNFSGPKANFKVNTCWMVAQFLAQKPVNFASLTDSLIWFSKLMFETLILNANTKRLSGAEELSEQFEKQAPGLEHPKGTRKYLGTSHSGSDPAGTPLIANIRQKNTKP